MKFGICNVGHGQCAYAVARNDNLLLVDCGFDPSSPPSILRPSSGCSGVEWLFVTNYDEDHVSGLPWLRDTHAIDVLVRNESVSPAELRSIKEEGGTVTSAMERTLSMMRAYSQPAWNPPTLPGLEWSVFHNNYPTDFTDTNNLSLVVFLRVGDLNVILPGDLEAPGWEKLLEQDAFVDRLKGVDVFVAAHHGRESGYFPDVFRYAHPQVIVFSDGPIEFDTQDMSAAYAEHASGVKLNGELRRVLTTRNDGPLVWNNP